VESINDERRVVDEGGTALTARIALNEFSSYPPASD
jgi:hypothetical protein